MAEKSYKTVSGRNLSLGWLADVYLVDGGNHEPVTMWLAAVTVVRQMLDFQMYSSLEPEWRSMVTQDDLADRRFGQWLIPLDIKAIEDLAIDGSQLTREVHIYEDRYVVHVEIAR